MSVRSARSGIVLPLRKRRKVQRRPAGRRRAVMAVLLALGVGVGVNLATRPRLTAGGDALNPHESSAALEAWPDSAGRAALRSRRLARLTNECPAVPPRRRQEVLDSFPSWPDDVLGLVACRRIRPGFTADQLRAAWGPPARIIPDLSGMRPMEQWDYGRRSVLLWDGQVKTWQ
ncbi:MAG: hypothetical protein ACREOC_12660 [Gemmatimonadales bacterium]